MNWQTIKAVWVPCRQRNLNMRGVCTPIKLSVISFPVPPSQKTWEGLEGYCGASHPSNTYTHQLHARQER